MDPTRNKRSEARPETSELVAPSVAVYTITVSQGPKNNPVGKRSSALALTAGVVRALAALLEGLPSAIESWWSPHTWERDRRSGRGWVAACAVVLDLDFHDDKNRHSEPASAVRNELRAANSSAAGNLFHDTPRGARIVFVLDRPTSNREAYTQAVSGAAALVSSVLEAHDLHSCAQHAGFAVDPAVKDFARFLYAPRAIVDDQARDAAIVVLREQPSSLEELAALASRPTVGPERRRENVGEAAKQFDEAVRRWNDDHRQDWGSPGQGECPACRHDGCFGRLPELPEKWSCFSNGPDGHAVRTQGRCGRPGNSGHWFGDALDIEAFGRGETRLQVLRRDGYIAVMSHEEPEAP